MSQSHSLLRKLVELADSIDMATMAAERGHFVALHAWLEEIRDDAACLADATRDGQIETEPEPKASANFCLKYPR
ncbi:MAG TPA: hypothetical protein VF051_02935 [Hyphomicrobiaceae bacterium]|jgi:hypothetical protein